MVSQLEPFRVLKGEDLLDEWGLDAEESALFERARFSPKEYKTLLEGRPSAYKPKHDFHVAPQNRGRVVTSTQPPAEKVELEARYQKAIQQTTQHFCACIKAKGKALALETHIQALKKESPIPSCSKLLLPRDRRHRHPLLPIPETILS